MASATPAVTTESFLKKVKERNEFQQKLKQIASLKGAQSQIKARLEELIPDVAATLVSFGQKKVEFDGFTHAVYEGTSVTISANNLKSVLMRKGLDPDLIEEVLRESTTRTTYTTITTLPVREKVPVGGLTGK